MIFRALSTTFLVIGGVGVFLRNADSDVISVLAWTMIAVGAIGQLFFGLIYIFFFRDS
jgi:TRAP-type C4-dicarboxylate transport system permease small subunit